MNSIFEYFKAWSKNMQSFISTASPNKNYDDFIAESQFELEKFKEHLLNEQFERISTEYFG